MTTHNIRNPHIAPHFIFHPLVILVILAIGAFVALGFLAAGPGTVGTAEAAKIERMLVGNTLHAGTSKSDQTSYDYAQGIRTGPNPSGYILNSLEIVFQDATPSKSGGIMDPRIELHRVDASGDWEPQVAWLEPDNGTPVATGQFTYTYNLPSRFMVEPSSLYYITVARSASMSLSLTRYTNEDPGGADGWSIDSNVATRGNSFIYTQIPHSSGFQTARVKLNGADIQPYSYRFHVVH